MRADMNQQYHERALAKARLSQRLRHIFKGDVGDSEPVTPKIQALHELARSLSVAGGQPFEEYLSYLLRHRDGRALATALLTNKNSDAGRVAKEKEFKMPSRVEVLKGLLRQHDGDVVALAKQICKTGSTDVTEAELCGIITAAAQSDRRSGESSEQAFARKFNDPSPDGIALRKATRLAAGYPVGEPDQNEDEPDDNNDDEDAYEELREKAVELRKHHPALSEAQSFALAYQQNPALAKKERRQSRPYLAVRER
jgi:hypothetical protein